MKCVKEYSWCIMHCRRKIPQKQLIIEMTPMTPTCDQKINTRIQKVLEDKALNPGHMKNTFEKIWQ